jgi:hypothetical protein
MDVEKYCRKMDEMGMGRMNIPYMCEGYIQITVL